MYVKNYRECRFCGRMMVTSRTTVHENKCLAQQAAKLIPVGTAGRQKGSTAWNKGLTKETDSRVVYGDKHPGYGRRWGNSLNGHSVESKQKLSETMSIRNKGGRCKWYEVDGQLLQGTWERDFAMKLTELGIKWVKIKTNSYTLKYIMDGVVRNYTPDFYLPDNDLFIEVKGFWWGRDKEKMRLVQEQHSKVNIVIIEKEQFDKIMGGELVW